VLEVVSVSGFLDQTGDVDQAFLSESVNARRSGLVDGTKVATTRGWKLVEQLVAGDLVRTLDNGFKEVRRISTNTVTIPAGENRVEYLPVFVPARSAYNGRPVWLMPEQGMALNLGKVDPEISGFSIVPARLLSGAGQLTSQAPGATFEVSSLFFDADEIVFVEGGLQAYCPSGRFTMRNTPGNSGYDVVEDDEAIVLVNSIAKSGDMSALANPLGALPAPIPQETVLPVRPPSGIRRPGRPGRPDVPALFLRSEWQT